MTTLSEPANLLSYTDQGLFRALRATDQESIIQATWIYEHPVDYQALRRFHQNFGYGVAGRLIEPSPLPFGRPRWVSVTGPQTEIDISEPRDRGELTDWVDERAQLPVDPQWGPGWRIGVLPMTDGSTAITLTGSHALGDGIGASMRVVQSVLGLRSELDYPAPQSRRRGAAVRADLRQAMHDLPETGRALRALARLARRRRQDRRLSGEASSSRLPARLPAVSTGDPHENVMLPAVFVTLDQAEWDATAQRLGGNGHSLLAGFAAKVAQRVGRVRADDGKATLLIPISERESFDDDRANAVAMSSATIDPRGISEDLTAARTAIRDGVQKARTEPDELSEIVALVPWLPKRLIRGMADAAFGFTADQPIFCSNIGDLPVEMLRIDGTEAECLFIRGIDRRVTRAALEKRSGLLTVMSGRVGGRILMSVVAYQPGWQNDKAALRAVVVDTLGDFGLSGRIE